MTSTSPRRRVTAAFLLVALVVGSATACSGDGADNAAATSTTAEGAADASGTEAPTTSGTAAASAGSAAPGGGAVTTAAGAADPAQAATTAVTGVAPGEATVAADVTAVPTTADPATDTAAGPTTPTLPRAAQVGLPPVGEEPRNQLDQPVRLDETASLACAHAEFAIEAIDAGDQDLARKEVAEIAVWGGPSANLTVAAAATALPAAYTAADGRAQVRTFLALCEENGHIL